MEEEKMKWLDENGIEKKQGPPHPLSSRTSF
jgi:hypothetical protein